MDAHQPDVLGEFPVVFEIPVQWGDQDAFGHVNNAVYLRWFESSRIAYFDRVGLLELIERDRIGPILASITCHYRRPITYPDTVRIGAKVARIGRTSLTMEHRLLTATSAATAAEGSATIVILDYARQQPHPVPAAIRQAIELLEGRPFPPPA